MTEDLIEGWARFIGVPVRWVYRSIKHFHVLSGSRRSFRVPGSNGVLDVEEAISQFLFRCVNRPMNMHRHPERIVEDFLRTATLRRRRNNPQSYELKGFDVGADDERVEHREELVAACAMFRSIHAEDPAFSISALNGEVDSRDPRYARFRHRQRIFIRSMGYSPMTMAARKEPVP